MRALKIFLFATALSIGLHSCYKYPDVSINNEQLDMTITLGDKTIDFTQYSTFTVEDTIRLVKIVNGEQESDSVLSMQDANHIMGELRQKMESYGYVYTADTAVADLVIVAHAMDVTNEGSGIDCYNPGYWWGYYPGWGYPGWGYPSYGYPWYGGGCYSYEYFNRRGTVVWDLFDKKNLANNQIEVIWTGAVIGVLNENGNLNKYTRIDRAITEAFIQSSYMDISSN